MILGGVEVAYDYADDVVGLELAWRTEAFFDVLNPLCYFFGRLDGHLPILILDLEEDD